MAHTELYNCKTCKGGIGLFGRAGREGMLVEQVARASNGKYCLDCFVVSQIVVGEPDICVGCGSTRLSTEYVLPCKCGGELIHEEGNTAMF